MKLVWTRIAKEDIDSIYQYYSTKSINSAIKLYNKIIEEAEILESFPHIGIIDPVLSDDTELIRSFIIISGKYKIVYFVRDDAVTITAVWSCSQDPNRLKKRKLK